MVEHALRPFQFIITSYANSETQSRKHFHESNCIGRGFDQTRVSHNLFRTPLRGIRGKKMTACPTYLRLCLDMLVPALNPRCDSEKHGGYS